MENSVGETEEECNTLRIFLMGKTGSGKSSTGNTILGEDKFPSKASLSSVTRDTEVQETDYQNITVKVMDSPGLFDTEQGEAEVAAILVKAVATLHPGPHVLLFVVRFGRYTAEDHGVYARLKALLDDRIKHHLIVVFTHADSLTSNQTQSIHQVISEGPDNLKDLMADCGNRFVLFNNHADDKKSQVADLMDMVMKLKNDNQEQPYQCPRYAYVAEKIEEETRKRLEEVERKELERSQYYQKLEEQLNLKEAELNTRSEELERKAQELERREAEAVKELQERIQELEEQVRSATSGNQDKGTDGTPALIAAHLQPMANPSSLQNDVITRGNGLASDGQKYVEINKQLVEVGVMAEENKKLQAELQEAAKKQQEIEEDRVKLKAHLEAMTEEQREKEKARKKEQDEIVSKKDQQVTDLQQKLRQKEQEEENEKRQWREQLKEAQDRDNMLSGLKQQLEELTRKQHEKDGREETERLQREKERQEAQMQHLQLQMQLAKAQSPQKSKSCTIL